MELYAAIRFDRARHQMSIRALAEKYSVHRRTVREAVASPVPPPRRVPVRSTVVLDSVRGLIDGMLAEDLAAPRKQRHTARRIHERLRVEHDAEVSYSYVAKYVHRRRPQLAAQAAARESARSGVVAGFVPQHHPPGAEAEVDFADLWVRLDGVMTKCFLFTLRLSHSGRAVHRVRLARAGGASGRPCRRVRGPGRLCGCRTRVLGVAQARMGVRPAEERAWSGNRGWCAESTPLASSRCRLGMPFLTTTWRSSRRGGGRTRCWLPPTT
ncbi:hypothetical protein ACFQV8_00080 [Pseudonocardia benzenivorans]